MTQICRGWTSSETRSCEESLLSCAEHPDIAKCLAQHQSDIDALCTRVDENHAKLAATEVMFFNMRNEVLSQLAQQTQHQQNTKVKFSNLRHHVSEMQWKQAQSFELELHKRLEEEQNRRRAETEALRSRLDMFERDSIPLQLLMDLVQPKTREALACQFSPLAEAESVAAQPRAQELALFVVPEAQIALEDGDSPASHWDTSQSLAGSPPIPFESGQQGGIASLVHALVAERKRCSDLELAAQASVENRGDGVNKLLISCEELQQMIAEACSGLGSCAGCVAASRASDLEDELIEHINASARQLHAELKEDIEERGLEMKRLAVDLDARLGQFEERQSDDLQLHARVCALQSESVRTCRLINSFLEEKTLKKRKKADRAERHLVSVASGCVDIVEEHSFPKPKRSGQSSSFISNDTQRFRRSEEHFANMKTPRQRRAGSLHRLRHQRAVEDYEFQHSEYQDSFVRPFVSRKPGVGSSLARFGREAPFATSLDDEPICHSKSMPFIPRIDFRRASDDDSMVSASANAQVSVSGTTREHSPSKCEVKPYSPLKNSVLQRGLRHQAFTDSSEESLNLQSGCGTSGMCMCSEEEMRVHGGRRPEPSGSPDSHLVRPKLSVSKLSGRTLREPEAPALNMPASARSVRTNPAELLPPGPATHRGCSSHRGAQSFVAITSEKSDLGSPAKRSIRGNSSG